MDFLNKTLTLCYGGNCNGGNCYGGNCYGGDCNGGNCYGGNCYDGNCYSGNYYDGNCYGGNCYGGNCYGSNCYWPFMRFSIIMVFNSTVVIPLILKMLIKWNKYISIFRFIENRQITESQKYKKNCQGENIFLAWINWLSCLHFGCVHHNSSPSTRSSCCYLLIFPSAVWLRSSQLNPLNKVQMLLFSHSLLENNASLNYIVVTRSRVHLRHAYNQNISTLYKLAKVHRPDIPTN